MARGGLCQNLPQLEGGEDGSDLRQKADDHQDGVCDEKAAILEAGNGNSDEAHDEDVEAENDNVSGGDEEHLGPKVQLFDLESV